MDYVRIFVNWVVCGHWCQLLNEYFQQTKSVDLSELRCVDISELCYLWSLVGFSFCTTWDVWVGPGGGVVATRTPVRPDFNSAEFQA